MVILFGLFILFLFVTITYTLSVCSSLLKKEEDKEQFEWIKKYVKKKKK